MGNRQIKSIINEYANHNIPEETKLQFGKWLSDDDERAAKEEALEELWNDTSIDVEPFDALKVQNRITNTIRNRDLRRHLRINIGVAAAAVVMLVGGLLIQRHLLLNESVAEPQMLCMVTAEGSKGFFTLSDGTNVWLNGNSTLWCPESFDGDKRAVRLEGEGYFDVAKNPAMPFVVSIDDYDIEVLGTQFDVKSYGKLSYKEIVLCEGAVKISSSTLAPIHMHPNDRLTIEGNGASIDRVNAENYRTWISDMLIFDNVPLGDIITNLQRWFNMEIKVAPKVNTQTRLSFNVKYESVEEIMKVISLIAPIKYRFNYNENAIYIYTVKK